MLKIELYPPSTLIRFPPFPISLVTRIDSWSSQVDATIVALSRLISWCTSNVLLAVSCVVVSQIGELSD